MPEEYKRSPVTLWFGRLLPIIGIAILLLVLFRQQQLREWSQRPPTAITSPRALAPRFELMDHNRHLVKFERFLGRQRVVVVFFDAELGADEDPRVRSLVDHYSTLKSAGIEVIAISTATPYANEQAEKNMPGQECPFPLITDIDIRNPIPNPTHRLWGAYDEEQDKPQPCLFFVARDGSIAVQPNGKPFRVQDEPAAIRELCQGKWPR